MFGAKHLMVRAIFNGDFKMILSAVYNRTVGPVWRLIKEEELVRLFLIMAVAAVAINCCQGKTQGAPVKTVPADAPAKAKP